MVLAVPLSRFTSRVGDGSAFFVRHRDCYAEKASICVLEFGWSWIALSALRHLVLHIYAQPHYFGRSTSGRAYDGLLVVEKHPNKSSFDELLSADPQLADI